MTLHSYPWYPADWLGSETRARLSQAGRNIFRELLDFCWKDGSLPTDKAALTRMIGCTRREFDEAWIVIGMKFDNRGGRLYHPRVDERRPELIDWREARREAGRRGGLASGESRSKRIKREAELPENDEANAKQNEAQLGLLHAENSEAKRSKPKPSSSSSSPSYSREVLSRGGESSNARASELAPSPQGEADTEFMRVARVLCETLPSGGEVYLTAQAIRAEFARSANFQGRPFEFATNLERCCHRWRAAYDENRELRCKPAQYWISDGIYAQRPPQARQRVDPGPVYLGEGVSDGD